MTASHILFYAVLLASCSPALAQSTLPASSADWILDGGQPTATFGVHVGPAGDVDGDGYDDVLIGDSSYDGAFADGGRITLYRGSASGLSRVPTWALEGSLPGALMAQAFAAGDVNGDGFDDVIVNDTARRLLWLFTGSPTGLLPTSWLYGGFPVGSGDINGDGFTDVAVHSRPFIQIFLGSAAGLEPLPSTSLRPTGLGAEIFDGPVLQDLNGDGYADLAFTLRQCYKGCIQCTDGCIALIGELSIHLGSSTGLESRPKRTIDLLGEVFPFVAAAGDVQADGFGDVAVTVHGDPAGSPFRPEDVLLVSGSRSGIRNQFDHVLQVPRGTLVPGGVRGAGDLNGDGFADLLVPGRYGSQPPAVVIFRGGAGGLSANPSTIIEAEQPDGGGFPSAASRAGDVNGDGLSDLIVGAPSFSSGGSRVGRVYVFYGRPSI